MRRAVLATVVALAVSGCGSTSLSLKELRTNATQICGQADQRMSSIPAPSSPAGEEHFLRQGAIVLGPELHQLQGLQAPSGVLDVFKVAVGAFGRKVSAIDQTLTALSAGDDPVVAIKSLQRGLGPIESQEDGAWQALQIPACLNR